MNESKDWSRYYQPGLVDAVADKVIEKLDEREASKSAAEPTRPAVPCLHRDIYGASWVWPLSDTCARCTGCMKTWGQWRIGV